MRLDARTSSEEALANFSRATIRAFLDVPLVKAGRLVAVLAVHSGTPRAWSSEDVALAEEIAEQTWAAATTMANMIMIGHAAMGIDIHTGMTTTSIVRVADKSNITITTETIACAPFVVNGCPERITEFTTRGPLSSIR